MEGGERTSGLGVGESLSEERPDMMTEEEVLRIRSSFACVDSALQRVGGQNTWDESQEPKARTIVWAHHLTTVSRHSSCKMSNKRGENEHLTRLHGTSELAKETVKSVSTHQSATLLWRSRNLPILSSQKHNTRTHVHRLSVVCSCLPSVRSVSDRTAGSTVMPCPHGLRTVSSWAATRASCRRPQLQSGGRKEPSG